MFESCYIRPDYHHSYGQPVDQPFVIAELRYHRELPQPQPILPSCWLFSWHVC